MALRWPISSHIKSNIGHQWGHRQIITGYRPVILLIYRIHLKGIIRSRRIQSDALLTHRLKGHQYKASHLKHKLVLPRSAATSRNLS